MRFFATTLGCKVNQYESRSLCEAWRALGLEETGDPGGADWILVNSCAVTAKAVADVRSAVRRLHRAAPQASILVTGCAAEVLADELAALPGVVAVVPQSNKDSLLAGLSAYGPGSAGNAFAALPPVGDAPPIPPYPAFAVSGYDRSRAVLKIQDGCSHGCAYCIVPLTRGRARSRPYEEALAEARRLLAAGFREIVISGVNLRQFHLAAPGTGGVPKHGEDKGDFWDFIARMDADLAPEWAGRARFRISSLEPGQLGDKALDTLAACRLVAPHLHLSLQSGSASVLKRMGRGHYDPALLPAFLAKLRAIWPCFALGADILTAFPGETEEEFAEGAALYRELPLTYAHVFPYSIRPGTRAAGMPDQVPADSKKSRAAALRALVSEKRARFVEQVSRMDRLQVVFEKHTEDEGPADLPKADRTGHTDGTGRLPHGVCEYYIDCMPAPGALPDITAGELTPVRPVGIADGMVLVAGKELL